MNKILVRAVIFAFFGSAPLEILWQTLWVMLANPVSVSSLLDPAVPMLFWVSVPLISIMLMLGQVKKYTNLDLETAIKATFSWQTTTLVHL